MTTFGPDGPMINRRYTVDKDRVNVEVTHEEDEADDDNEDEYELAEAENEAGEQGADEPVYPRMVDVDGDRWIVAEKPLADRLDADPGMKLLEDATEAELLERLEAFVKDRPHQPQPYRADPSKLDALREELRANFPRNHEIDVISEEMSQAKVDKAAILDDIIADMRRLAEKFDVQAEKMTKTQIQQSVTRIAFAVADVAETVKGRIS